MHEQCIRSGIPAHHRIDWRQYPAALGCSDMFRFKEKTAEKSTYPPPANGLCVPFLCKGGWGGKSWLRPSPLRGLWAVLQLHEVQGFANKCSGLAQRYGAGAI